MFAEIEARLDTVNKNITKTNEILAKIEENLRVPDMITWAKILEELKKKF